MTLKAWLQQSTQTLHDADIPTARLDALVLLEDCLGLDRARILAHPEVELTSEQQTVLDGQIKVRATHEPLAYIRHKSEFYGREFYIDHRVLEPRPESETIIDLLKTVIPDLIPNPDKKTPNRHAEFISTPVKGGEQFLKHAPIIHRAVQDDDQKNGRSGNDKRKPVIIDIGTGSGMLAITAKLEFPEMTVIATDIDQNCLDVARQNAKTYLTDIAFLQGDLLQPLASISSLSPTILLCNLPYVPDHFQINPAAMREPRVAIFGGADGLDLYRKLFTNVSRLAQKPAYIFTESLPPQHQQLTEIAARAGYQQVKRDDFIQVFCPL